MPSLPWTHTATGRNRSTRKPRVRGRLVLAPLLLTSAIACAGPAPGPPAGPELPLPRPTRGYILISFDTLRADHLGAYGYERDTSPFFDQLARRGTLFTQAHVQYPSTLTSHMSMLTGLYPAEHGVYPPDGVLPDGIQTVAQVFQRAGFETAGHTEGGYVRGFYGFRRGFDEFRARDRQSPREIEVTFGRGVDFLESLAPEDRFFLFLHTYAVHAPYEPPEGYENLFWQGEPPQTFPPTGPQLARHNAEGSALSPEVLAYFEALYDATIRHADDTLRSFFADLERLGLANDVTVILTSDHGEEFQEHGRMNHEQLYREVMRVPLLVVHPDLGAGRYEPLVESVDLAPTLYELVRLTPQQNPSGVSLARRLGRTTPAAGDAGRDAYAEVASGVRALWRWQPPATGDSPGRLLHLLLFEPPDGSWVKRRLKLDTSKRTLTLEARSYEQPRTLTVTRLDPAASEIGAGEVLGTFPLTGEWSPLRLSLGAPRVKHTLELSVPGCTVPEEVERLRRGRCLGFTVRGVPRVRTELYDTVADPRETHDLSARLDAETRALVRSLWQRAFSPRAERQIQELDPETEAQLKALGYLQ